MGEIGQVTEVKDGLIKIRMENTARCEGCTCSLSREHRFLTAKNDCGASQDDWVRVEIRSNLFFNAVFIAYGIPFIALVAGFAGGYLLASGMGSGAQEVVGFLFGIAASAFSFLVVKRLDKQLDQALYTPVATQLEDEPLPQKSCVDI